MTHTLSKYIGIVLCTLLCHTGNAQLKITGKITEQGNIPLPGVNIGIKGTDNSGTASDSDGNFSITVPSPASILQFSFIGFVSREVKVNNRTFLHVNLEEDITKLDEVIVTGYASQTKREIISSISSVSSKDMNFTATSLEQSIQGLAPGIRIGLTNGTPGAEMDFHIRGIGTINSGSSPLCIIDGVAVEDGLRSINPADVESIQILKDAASAAIYGSRGANGVILITTQEGKEGKPRFTLEAKVGVTGAEKKYDMMNAAELAEFMDEAGKAYWSVPGYDPNLDTDWQDAAYRNAFTQNYNLSVSGGGNSIRYLISASFLDQPGQLIETSFRKYTLRSNLRIDLSRKVKLTLNLAHTTTKQKYVNDAGQIGSNPVMSSILFMPPMFPVYYNGNYWTQNNYTVDDLQPDPRDPSRLPPTALPFANVENPVKMLKEQDRTRNTTRANGMAALEIKLLPGLSFKPSFGFDNYDFRQRMWYPASIGARTGRITDAKASFDITHRFTWSNENVLTYTNEFNKNHKLLAVAGASFQGSTTGTSHAEAKQFESDALETVSGGTSFSATDMPDINDRLASFFGRANYTLYSRYLFGAVFRADGSSKFGSNNRFGYFPSFSAGWIVTEEPFMKKAAGGFLNELKIRASWGVTGNNSIGNFKYLTMLNSKNYIFDGVVANGYVPGNIENPDLKWEKNTSANLGMDIGLFANRLFLMVDLYRAVTSDMLLNVNIPSTLGQSSLLMNMGEVENKGLELNVTSKNLTGRFKWSTNFNISFNKNKVLSLNTAGDKIFDGENDSNITMEGHPIGMFYGRVYQGVYMNWEEIKQLAADPESGLAFDPKTVPGDMKFVDLNGDGAVDDDDRTVLGSPHPKFVFGMSNNFAYKNFSLSVLLTGQYGNKIYNYSIHPLERSTNNNQSRRMIYRFRSEEQPGDGWHPSIRQSASADKNKFSTYQLEDGSYLRIRNIAFGYDLPKKMLARTPFRSCTFSINADNLYTFTRYTGQNVEANNNRRATAPGLDFASYPSPRTFTFGIKTTF